MSPALFLSFIITCLIIESTPGPNMAYLAIVSASDGRRSGFATTAGIALGLFAVGIIAALGVSAIISNSPFMYHALRMAGICYLFWLAWDGWKPETETSPGKINGAYRNKKFFVRGLVTNLLNPKAAVFYVAILPRFLSSVPLAMLHSIFLTLTYVTIATAIHCLIVMLAGAMHDFLKNNKKRLIVRRGLSIALAFIAIWFAWKTGYNLKN